MMSNDQHSIITNYSYQKHRLNKWSFEIYLKVIDVICKCNDKYLSQTGKRDFRI